MSADTPRLAAALPSLSQCARRSQVVHAATVEDVPLAEHVGGGTYPYTADTALCGAPSWGPAVGATADPPRLNLVNCSNCVRTFTWRRLPGDLQKTTQDVELKAVG